MVLVDYCRAADLQGENVHRVCQIMSQANVLWPETVVRCHFLEHKVDVPGLQGAQVLVHQGRSCLVVFVNAV